MFRLLANRSRLLCAVVTNGGGGVASHRVRWQQHVWSTSSGRNMAPGYYACDNNRHRYFSSSDTNIPDDAEPDPHVVTEDLPPPRFPEKPKSALQKRRGGDSGRVVAYQEGKSRQKSKAPKLCAGCGAQVIFQRNEEQQLFKTGVDAVDPTLSKKQAKLARYYDTFGHKHNTENPFLCERCIALKSENIWKAYDALHDVEASVFRNQISHIVGRRRWGLCIMVVDATDPEHSAIKKLRDCIGKKTAVWIAINKIDLVPRMSPGDQRQLRMRIENISDKKTIKCFAVSAKTGAGVLELAEAMLANLRGQDVFVVGSANVGKSSLVQRMTCTIARGNIRFKGRQGAKRRDMLKDLVVTGSHLPGTTLQAVRVPCFPSIKHALWDTPGIINRKALQYSLFPTHLMEPLARPEPVPVPTRENGLMGILSTGYSLLVEADWMDRDYDLAYESEMDQNTAENREERTNEATLESVEKPKDEPEDEPCVLARIDVISVSASPNILAQAYLHPSLRVRVVETSLAPDHAKIPPGHVKRISEKIRRAAKNPNSTKIDDHETYSLPLRPHQTKINPEGFLSPSSKEQSPNTGKFFMDLCFASLGFISFTHESDFVLRPFCVKGSVYSRRKALYPVNMREWMDLHPVEEQEDLSQEAIERRLRDAAEKGRHQKSKWEDTYDPTGYEGGDFVNLPRDKISMGDDEWF